MAKTLKQALQQLKKSICIIAKERDKMRAVLEEFEDIIEVSDRALEALEESIDILSEEV
jgi:hypothetical protein